MTRPNMTVAERWFASTYRSARSGNRWSKRTKCSKRSACEWCREGRERKERMLKREFEQVKGEYA